MGKAAGVMAGVFMVGGGVMTVLSGRSSSTSFLRRRRMKGRTSLRSRAAARRSPRFGYAACWTKRESKHGRA